MRLRPVDLSVFGLAMIGLVPAGHANELDRVWLRGSQVEDIGPGYSGPSYSGPSSPGPSYPVLPPPQAYPAPPPAYPGARQSVRKPAVPPQEFAGFTFDFGTRIWYSTGKLAKDLFDDPRSSSFMNSRLTYSGLSTATFEGFARADAPTDTFLKGFAGIGNLHDGQLDDEDFPPNTLPYSSTLSQQQGGRISYGAADIGQTVIRRERFNFGGFVGYGFLAEKTNAYGCSQIAGNNEICVPTINTNVIGITEDSRWQFVRLGFNGEVKLRDRMKLSGEIAWLPFVQLVSYDTHWLRLGTDPFDISGPAPEFGSGTGFQAEALLSYQITDRLGVGLGARYWYMETKGKTDFESVIVDFPDPGPQPLNFNTTRYGGFVQSSYKLGPL